MVVEMGCCSVPKDASSPKRLRATGVEIPRECMGGKQMVKDGEFKLSHYTPGCGDVWMPWHWVRYRQLRADQSKTPHTSRVEKPALTEATFKDRLGERGLEGPARVRRGCGKFTALKGRAWRLCPRGPEQAFEGEGRRKRPADTAGTGGRRRGGHSPIKGTL